MSLDDIYKKIANPKYFGPGDWIYMHQLALDAETDDDIDFCIRTIKSMTHYLTCLDCNEHGHQHIKDNDPESYRNWRDESGKRRGMFKCTVDYHNAASRNSGGKEMSYDDALALWLGVKGGACKGGCASTSTSQPITGTNSTSVLQSIPTPVPQTAPKSILRSSSTFVPQSTQRSTSPVRSPTNPPNNTQNRSSSIFSTVREPMTKSVPQRSTSPTKSSSVFSTVREPMTKSVPQRSTSPTKSSSVFSTVREPTVTQQPPVLSFGTRTPQGSVPSSKQFQPYSKIIPSSPIRSSSIFSSSYVNNDFSNRQSPYSKPSEEIVLQNPQPLSTGESSDEEGDIINDVIVVDGKSYPISIRTGQNVRHIN